MGHNGGRLTILGGGPAGLATAFYAHRAGIPFALFEKSPELGGLCRTFRFGEHRYDSGAHRFHDRDPDITGDVRQLLGNELIEVTAPNRIYDGGSFIDFPPTPLALLAATRPAEIGRIGWEIARARRNRRPPESFADFAVGRFGETLAQRYLLGYSEKVWGLPAEQLAPEVATRRLNGMTLGSLLREVFAPARKSAHIDGDFLYPRLGYGQIAATLAASLPASALHTGHEAAALHRRGGEVRDIQFADGGAVEIEGRIVSTIPLPLLARLLGSALPAEAHEAAAGLRFRHLRLIFLRLAQPQVSGNASIYLPDPCLSVSRVSEPKNRSPAMAPAGETSLIAEVACFAGDPIEVLLPETLAQRVVGELAGIGLIDPANVVEWRHHWLANAYPVYALDYQARVETIRCALSAIANLDTIGRAGTFFYSSLHDQLRFGKDYVAGLGTIAH